MAMVERRSSVQARREDELARFWRRGSGGSGLVAWAVPVARAVKPEAVITVKALTVVFLERLLLVSSNTALYAT
eukprot:2022022-Prymnesium_polylepis.1